MEYKSLIPKAYTSVAFNAAEDITPAEQQRHLLVLLFSLNFQHQLLGSLLTKSTKDFLIDVQPLTLNDRTLGPHLKTHESNFPERYKLPSHIGGAVLMMAYSKMSQLAKTKPNFDLTAPGATLIHLLKGGANPMPMLMLPGFGPHDIDQYLSYSPVSAGRDYKGHTLAHRYGGHNDFVEVLLPILIKHKTDINSVSTISPTGTTLHVTLANEHRESALNYIRATKGLLDPTKRDAQRKTLPIIAAKARMEDALLLIAEYYPDNLDLKAQDENGCTALHYCHALGLAKAAARLKELGARTDIKDENDLTPLDYLELTRDKTMQILYSIEIHGERDAGATHSAILGTENYIPVLVNNEPVLAIKENFNAQVTAATHQQFGPDGLQVLKKQFDAMQGVSLVDHIFRQREIIKLSYKKGMDSDGTPFDLSHS